MICARCQKETSPRLSTSGKLVCPECGIEAGQKVWFCAHCQKAVEPTIFASLERGLPGYQFREHCPNCERHVQPWPSDLPLPTEGNVRALVQANQRLAARARAAGVMEATAAMEASGSPRVPGPNTKGWWN